MGCISALLLRSRQDRVLERRGLEEPVRVRPIPPCTQPMAGTSHLLR